MTIEEAIKTALEYETKVRNVYKEATEKAKDQIGKRVFQTLANEEQYHLDFLTEKLHQLKDTGTVKADDLKTSIPSKEVIRAGISKLEKHLSKNDSLDQELDLLKKALQVELETSSYYKRMVQELPPEGQKFFSRFVEIEEGHVAIVQAEMDAVQGLGFWFDFQEFSLEAG